MSRLHGDRFRVTPAGADIAPQSYMLTVTWTGNTVSSSTGFYKKSVGKLEVWVSFVISVGTVSGAVSIPLPTGYSSALATPAICTSLTGAFAPTAMQAAAGALTNAVSGANSVAGVLTYLFYISIPTTV